MRQSVSLALLGDWLHGRTIFVLSPFLNSLLRTPPVSPELHLSYQLDLILGTPG